MANSMDPDQTARMRRLVWIHAGRKPIMLVLSWHGSYVSVILLQLNSIRQKLQKTKDQGTKQRSSPIPGNHNALLQTAPAVLMRSPAIGIHIPKTSIPRYQRNSVEGLNPVSFFFFTRQVHLFYLY
jgi:hypothetical protein